MEEKEEFSFYLLITRSYQVGCLPTWLFSKVALRVIPGLPDLGKPSLPPSPKFTATWRPFTATKFDATAIFTAILP
jgi:hypothetical protein